MKRFAVRIGAVDVPNGRKVHERPIPRLGGVAIFAAFNLTMLLLVSPFGVLDDPFTRVANQWWIGFIEASAIVI
ncbi:MAG: undecaprenyl/decaprenyl-phosphate alpha-N-acetylglucosaminyl 1-phosphate transferase, partial [Verrucomicrobiia bacterium]